MSAAKKLESIEKSKARGSWNFRILIVEDQPEVAESYTDILVPEANVVPIIRSSRSQSKEEGEAPSNGFPFEVKTVSSAKEAIDAVKQALRENRPFAMGFLDVLLGPGMDGIELLKEIQAMDEKFYGVLVTAYHDRDIHSINEFLGEDKVDRWDYLNKPFTKGEILQKARNYISLWNLKEDNANKRQVLADMQKQLFDSERFSAVAAVARGVSHEFGNVLVQIMGKSDLGRSQGEEKMRDSLEKIYKASVRASEILERFNHLANPAKQSFKKDPIELATLVGEALDLLDHQLKSHNVKVCKIKNDRALLQINHTAILQVLTNLMINSIHAMPHGGQIDISLVKHEKYMELKLRDFGTGIESDNIDKILEPFFTTKGEKGTGLGLPICKEIVEVEHGGSFKVYNHELKGFVVEMHFPLEEVV